MSSKLYSETCFKLSVVGQSRMSFEGRWLLNRGQFITEMNILVTKY